MKKTLRTMMLVAVGVLGSAAVASAQPAPAPQPPAPPGAPAAPTPPAQPPPADFGVAPAALPAAPVANAPVPTVNWGNQPAPDSATPPAPKPKKKANPFLLTRFNWSNTASTNIFGLGQDYVSTDNHAFSMDFTMNVRYAPIADSTKRFFINANFGVSGELTNSDSTNARNEWMLRDTSVGLGYQHKVYSNDAGFSLTPLVSANVILPTSKTSWGTGRYATTSINAGFMSGIPLASKSDWFSDTFIIGIGGWSHLFARSFTPTNEVIGVQRPRMGPDGLTSSNDQLSGTSLAMDNARFLVAAYTTIYKDLSFNLSAELLLPFRHQFGAVDCVQTSTGCVALEPSVTKLNPMTTFDVGISYTLFGLTRIDLGYQNITAQLDGGSGGKRRSFFYGPDAAFYTNVSVFVDSLLDKAFNLTGGPTAARAAKNNFGPSGF